MKQSIIQALDTIEGQLYAINSRNISLRWIGMRKEIVEKDIFELNQLLGFIIEEIRTLKNTGELDVEKVHKKYFKQ
jgi:hypothetical protein